MISVLKEKNAIENWFIVTRKITLEEKMVIRDKSKKCYICEECEFAYLNKKKACECEEFCRKHKSCDIEITKFSIMKGGQNETKANN